MTITAWLQRQIVESGLSLTAITKSTGVSQPILSRFLSDDPKVHRDIRLATADKLAEFFGMQLTPPRSVKEAKPASKVIPAARRKVSTTVGRPPGRGRRS